MKKKFLSICIICICFALCFALVACDTGEGSTTIQTNSGGGSGGGSGSGSGGGNGSDGDTEITSIFSGYNLPQNCKLVWNEPSNFRKTVVKIGDDCVYTDVYVTTGSVVSSYYYKKTANGYTVYLDEGNGLGYSYNTTFTYQQAADEFKIEVGNKYFKPSITITTSSEPATLTTAAGTFSTKKYVASPLIYWVMSDYDILQKSEAYGTSELTVFNSNVTSFENAGVALNV